MDSGWKKDYFRYKSFFLNVVSLYNTKPSLRIYLELMLSLGAVVVFLMFAIKPTILTIIQLNKDIKAKEETSSQLQQKIGNLQAANNILLNQAENISYIYKSVPITSEPEILIRQVEKLATDSSLSIINFSMADITIKGDEPEGKPNKNELNFTFAATGSYQNLFSFLKNLERLQKPVKLDTLLINSSTTEEGKVIVLTVTAKVPFLPEKKDENTAL